MRNYIKQHIIKPLTDALYSEEGMDAWEKGKVYSALMYCNEQNAPVWQIAEAMHPLYEKYIYSDPLIHGFGKWAIKELILWVMNQDDDLFEWIQEREGVLLESAHAWAAYQKENQGNSHDYLNLLKTMSATFYSYWYDTPTDEVRRMLVKEKVEGNPYSREIYCIFHAFITIWDRDNLSTMRKSDLFSQVVEHWSFIRHLYSAMLQRVVGTGRSELSAIIHDVKLNHRQHPFAHLLHAAVEEHRERIIRSGTKAYNLDKAMKALREVVATSEPSAELDEVVGIIFSDKLKEYLLRHQPKSYQELESELYTLRSGMDERTRQIQTLMAEQAEMLRQMAETSVSIEVITEELLRLPAGTAYGVYEKLNALLQKDEAWRNHADAIRDRVLEHEKNYHNQLYFNAPVGTVVAHADKVVNNDKQ